MQSKHPVIEQLLSPRLRLTPVRLANLQQLHTHWIKPDVRKHLWDDRIITPDDVWDAIGDSLELEIETGIGLLNVHEISSAVFVGVAGFVRLNKANASAEPEFMYSFEPNYWNKGFAQEAVSTIMHYAFQTLRLPRVLASADQDNTRSTQLLSRLRMQPIDTGPTRGLHYMQITRADFLSAHNNKQLARQM
jgi:RimJ/RimL family protein N-acetyltransferase